MTVLVALVTLDGVSAWSAALGGMISIIPNAYFAHRVFRHTGARSIEKAVRSAFLGEFIKLVLMGAGFALVFVLVDPLRAPALFGGFLLVHLGGLMAVVRHFRQREQA